MKGKRPRGQKNRLRRLLLFLILGLAAPGCAPPVAYYQQIDSHLLREEYTAAQALIKDHRNDFGRRNALLYYLDEGIVAHFAARFDPSNQSLQHSETIMDALFTRSVSDAAASYILNDNTTAYRGEDFESALVNLFMALNYAGLGNLEDALVEARKVDVKLSVLNARYEPHQKNVYREDAFIRLLMGILYEAGGEINDAFVSYRQALAIYRSDYLSNYGTAPPDLLIENLIRTARAMGFVEEQRQIERQYPQAAATPTDAPAEIYLIHYSGRGPEKVEERFFIPMPDGFVVKIAYPAYRRQPSKIDGSRLQLKNLTTGAIVTSSSVLGENIAAIAETNLQRRIVRIKAKAVARATAKYLAAREAEKKARKKQGDDFAWMVRLMAQTAAVLTERADLRHWRLLPAAIRIARVPVVPGRYAGRLLLTDSSGRTVRSRPVSELAVAAGEKKFVMVRSLD